MVEAIVFSPNRLKVTLIFVELKSENINFPVDLLEVTYENVTWAISLR